MGDQDSFLYSFVSRGTAVLAEHVQTSTGSSLDAIAEKCLHNLPSNANKFSYNHDHHTFFFIVDHGYAYCVAAKNSMSQTLPFAYLDRVKTAFNEQYGGGKADTAAPKSLNKEFGPIMAEHMKNVISHAEEIDKLTNLKSQVSDIEVIILDNIDKVRDRVENLTNLVGKAEELGSMAQDYKDTGKKVRTHMWLQNTKMKLTSLGILLLLALIIWVSVCHGFSCSN